MAGLRGGWDKSERRLGQKVVVAVHRGAGTGPTSAGDTVEEVYLAGFSAVAFSLIDAFLD